MTALDREIDYQFACRYVALLERMFDRSKRNDIYEEYLFWGILTQNIANISVDYRNRHPEKPWDLSACIMSINCYRFHNGNPTTLLEIESEIKRIDKHVDELKKVPICDCPECDNDSIYDYLYQQKYWYKKTSCSKNLTLDFLEKYWVKPWCLYYLAANMMTNAKAQFKKEYLAALKIQDAFLQARYNPTYAYCRRKHIEFYQSLA